MLISLFIQSQSTSFVGASASDPSFIVNNTKRPFCGVMGLQSRMRGSFIFKGYFRIFNIQFKPVGFSSIFKIPAAMIMNKFYDAEDLFNQELKELQEQLHGSINLKEMVVWAEKYLEGKLRSNKNLWKNDCLRKASNSLLNEPNVYSMEQLAAHSNLTLKTFERKFIDQVGVPPKLYARIRRFNYALEMKMYCPQSSWMDVCFQSGYFDQMHLVRDFKAFTGQTPSAFFRITPPVFESISS
jgi:AraC-like DNA-binding protein